MPALSTFAVANETTVTTIEDTRTHIIAGVGSNQRAFVIDDVVDDAPGYTLVFCNNCYPQFQNPRTFTFGDNANETRIVEAGGFTLNGTTYTAAAQVGRTTYFSDDAVGTAATGGRFRPLNQTHKVTIRNVKWGIESAGSGFAAARANGFHFGGGLRANLSGFPSSTAAADGMPMVCNGLRVYGRHGNSQMINKNLEVVNNETLGYGLRMELWDSDADNLTFVLGFGAVPNTQYTGFQLARYNSSNVLVKAGFQVLSLNNENVIPADGALTFEGADVSGADMFNGRGGGNGSMVCNFIDPVGEPGRAVASLRRGNIRIFRTQTFNYTGAVFASGEDEHLVIDQTTSGAPSWADPANLTSHSGGTFSQVLAVKQMPDTSGSFSNVYNNYRTFTVGYGYRRQSDTFSIATSGALADRSVTLTPDLMADGSRITAFTPDQNDEVDTLDELKRAAKTREVGHPHLAESEAYIITNSNNEYEIKQHNGTAGNVLFTTAAHSSYFTTTSSGYTIHNADGSVTGGNAAGLRGAAIQVTGTGLTLDFPRADNASTVRRIRMTGSLNCKGAIFDEDGNRIAYQSRFRNSAARMFAQGLTSATGTIRWAISCVAAERLPNRGSFEITSGDPLTIEAAMAIGVVPTEAESGANKIDDTTRTPVLPAHVSFSIDWSGATPVPSARLNLSKATGAQAAFSVYMRELNNPTSPESDGTGSHGLEYYAAGGELVNYETFKSSGSFFMLGRNTLLRRVSTEDSAASAALTAEAISPTGVWVDASRGDVPYVPGISLADIRADLTDLKTAVSTDFDTAAAGTQDLKTRLDTILTAVNNSGGGGGSLTAAQVVDAIKAADFGSAAGTQTLETILGAIQGAVVTDFDTSEAGTQTLKQRLDDLHASHGTIIAAIPTISAIVTAIQAADFGSAAGTQTLQTLLGNLLTAINSRATNAGAATAVWGHASDIDTGQSGVQTPAALLVTAASAKGAVDDLNDISTADVTSAVPTAAQNAAATAAATFAKLVDTGLDFEEAMKRTTAVLAGASVVDQDGNRVTFKDQAGNNYVRVTRASDSHARATVEIIAPPSP